MPSNYKEKLEKKRDESIRNFLKEANINGGFSTNFIPELMEQAIKLTDYLKLIASQVKPHRDGLEGRFEETISTVAACKALADFDSWLERK